MECWQLDVGWSCGSGSARSATRAGIGRGISRGGRNRRDGSTHEHLLKGVCWVELRFGERSRRHLSRDMRRNCTEQWKSYRSTNTTVGATSKRDRKKVARRLAGGSSVIASGPCMAVKLRYLHQLASNFRRHSGLFELPSPGAQPSFASPPASRPMSLISVKVRGASAGPWRTNTHLVNPSS